MDFGGHFRRKNSQAQRSPKPVPGTAPFRAKLGVVDVPLCNRYSRVHQVSDTTTAPLRSQGASLFHPAESQAELSTGKPSTSLNRELQLCNGVS